MGISDNDRRAYRTDSRNRYWRHVYKKHNFVVDILVNDISWEDACELECFLIQEYGRKDLGTGILCNMTEGGEGTQGRVLTEEHKRRISEGNKGKHLSMYLPQLEKAWATNRGIKRSEEFKINLGKEVYQFDKLGVFIKKFGSITKAAEDTGCKRNKISRVCRKGRRTTGGFYWSFDRGFKIPNPKKTSITI